MQETTEHPVGDVGFTSDLTYTGRYGGVQVLVVDGFWSEYVTVANAASGDVIIKLLTTGPIMTDLDVPEEFQGCADIGGYRVCMRIL